MKATALALALGTMVTVEQRDAYRSHFDPASAAISADGRFVAFTTHSRLAQADIDDMSDVYVLDRARLDVTLESAGSGQIRGDTSHPGISSDGRYIVFERALTVVLRDRRDAATTIIGMGRHPTITEDGRHVLFAAGTFGSVAGADVNGNHTDVYAMEWRTGRTVRVSVGLGRDESMMASTNPSSSSDGRYVAFTSRVQPSSNRLDDANIFVRDTERKTTRHVGSGWDPSISGDGRFVAFAGISNQLPHIFLADLHLGATRIITTSARRGLANGPSAKPKISADGRYVVFQSEASDLEAREDINLLWDVFVFDRVKATMTRISGDPEEVWMEPSGGPTIDGRGSTIAFSSRHPTDASDKRNDFDLYVASERALVGAAKKEGDGPFGPPPYRISRVVSEDVPNRQLHATLVSRRRGFSERGVDLVPRGVELCRSIDLVPCHLIEQVVDLPTELEGLRTRDRDGLEHR
jgi:TolB protein